MMLYTIIPPSDIFPQPAQNQIEYKPRNHGFLGISKGPNGNVIQSLVSTNPFDYLLPELSPGSPYLNK